MTAPYGSDSQEYAQMRMLEAELEQSQEIRADMAELLSIIGERLGVPEEPHQTWQERLLAALPAKDEPRPRHVCGLQGFDPSRGDKCPACRPLPTEERG